MENRGRQALRSLCLAVAYRSDQPTSGLSPGSAERRRLGLSSNKLSIGLAVDAATGVRSGFCDLPADAYNAAATAEIPILR